MGWFRFRFTIRAMMIWVVIVAIALTIGIAVHQTIGPFVEWERSPGPLRAFDYVALHVALTAAGASPFVIAVCLGLAPPAKRRAQRRRLARWMVEAFAVAIGLTILNYPIAGKKWARSMRDGSTVAFYHQYRIWPGEHVTPCLMLISPDGQARSYPISRNVRYHALPEMRVDASQTTIWFIDAPRATYHYGHGLVWCSLNRITGEFVGAGGPYPAGVGFDRGQTLTQVAR
jgi:hypothetical protein